MNNEDSMIANICRVIVDAERGKYSEEVLQNLEKHIVIQRDYIATALYVIKRAREKLQKHRDSGC